MSKCTPKAKIIVGGYLREFEDRQKIRIPRDLNSVFLVFYLGQWEQLKETPYKVMFNTLTINNAIFFFPDYIDQVSPQSVPLNNYITRKYLDPASFRPECYKYDPETRQYSEFTSYPPQVTSTSKTVSYCPQTDQVTLIGGTQGVFATLNMNGAQYRSEIDTQYRSEIDTQYRSDSDSSDLGILSVEQIGQEPQWDLTRNFKGVYETTGSNPASVYIDGKFHMIGGHNSYYHEVWDDRQKRMKPVYKFSTRLKSRELVYCRRLDSLIMFGGCLWNERDFQQTQRFRYIDGFYQCRRPNDLKNIKWHKVKDWRLPYKMIGFGHVLIGDSKLVIFGGRRSGGAFLDEVWMLDMEQGVWSKSTIKIPEKGKYRAHLIERKEQSEIHLFQYGHSESSNQCHFVMAVSDLLNTMETVSALSWARRSYESQSKAPNRVAMDAITDRLVHEALSKNERKKLLKKLKGKLVRQCKVRWDNRYNAEVCY